jgi:hypothetical protein
MLTAPGWHVELEEHATNGNKAKGHKSRQVMPGT